MLLSRIKKHGFALSTIVLVCISYYSWFASIPFFREVFRSEHPEVWHSVSNNSDEATTFTLHAPAYSLLSEDFYLYKTRAKRFLENGLVQNILQPSSSEVQPLCSYYAQTLINLIPALLGQSIPANAAFTALLIFIVYSVFYVFLYRQLSNSYLASCRPFDCFYFFLF